MCRRRAQTARRYAAQLNGVEQEHTQALRALHRKDTLLTRATLSLHITRSTWRLARRWFGALRQRSIQRGWRAWQVVHCTTRRTHLRRAAAFHAWELAVAAGARRTAMLTQVATMWRTTHHLSFAFDRWFTHHTDHAAAAAAQTRQATADLRFWSCVRSSVHARSMGDWWLRWLRHVYGRHARKSSGANRGLKLVLRKRQEELDALKQRCSDCSNGTTAAQAALADAETREQGLQQALMAAEHAQELA